jgi:hypothetical protein
MLQPKSDWDPYLIIPFVTQSSLVYFKPTGCFETVFMQVQNSYLTLNFRKLYISVLRDVIFYIKPPVWTGEKGPIFLSAGICKTIELSKVDIFINFASFHTLCRTEHNVRKNKFFGKMQAVRFIKKFKGICQIGLHSKLQFMVRRKY